MRGFAGSRVRGFAKSDESALAVGQGAFVKC